MAVDNPYTGGKSSLDELYRARMATRHLEEASKKAAKNSPYAAIRRNVDANTLIMEQAMEDRMANAATNGLSTVTGTPRYTPGNAAGYLKFNPPVDPNTGQLSNAGKPRTMTDLMEEARVMGQNEQALTKRIWAIDQSVQSRKKNHINEPSKVTHGSTFAGIAAELVANSLVNPKKLTPSSELATSSADAYWLPDEIDPTGLSQETFADYSSELIGRADNPQSYFSSSDSEINTNSPLFSKSAKHKHIYISDLSVGDDGSLIGDVALYTGRTHNDYRRRSYKRVRTSIKFDDKTMVKTKDGKVLLFKNAEEKDKYVAKQTSTTNAVT